MTACTFSAIFTLPPPHSNVGKYCCTYYNMSNKVITINYDQINTFTLLLLFFYSFIYLLKNWNIKLLVITYGYIVYMVDRYSS